MLSRPEYNAEICAWATSAGLECMLKENPGSFFDLVKIQKDEASSITLVTVSLKAWVASGPDNFNLMQEMVFSRRNANEVCVVLWEDFWVKKPELVQSRISALLQQSERIPARLTKPRRIDQQLASAFLEKNHLNGATAAKFKFGLFLPQRYFRVLKSVDPELAAQPELLVAVATFSYPRIFMRNEEPHKSYELIRFASLAGSNVVGGLDKLLRAFQKERMPDDIMSYADRDWSDGKSYRKLGFEETGITEPEPFLLSLSDLNRLPFAAKVSAEDQVITIRNLGNIKFVKTFEYTQKP